MAVVGRLGTSLLILAVGVSIGWILRTHFAAPNDAGDDDPEESVSVEPADLSVAVQVVPVTEGDLPVTLTAVGQVRADPSSLISVTSRNAGRVNSVPVRVGTWVEAGAPLVMLDTRAAELAVSRAKATRIAADNQLSEFDGAGSASTMSDLELAVAQATADLAQSAAELARVTLLFSDGLVAQKTVLEATQSHDRAERDLLGKTRARKAFSEVGGHLQRDTLVAARDAARADELDAIQILAEAVVLAPTAGVVVEVDVHVGDRVDAGAPLATVLRSDRRAIVFGVTPPSAASLAVGANVAWLDASGADRTAVVSQVAQTVDPILGLVEITAFPAEGEALPAPGLVVRGDIEVRRLTHALIVPLKAIVRSDGRTAVVVASQDGVAHTVFVDVRCRHRALAAVAATASGEGLGAEQSQGLKAGDRVIVDGAPGLPDGAHLRIVSSEPTK